MAHFMVELRKRKRQRAGSHNVFGVTPLMPPKPPTENPLLNFLPPFESSTMRIKPLLCGLWGSFQIQHCSPPSLDGIFTLFSEGRVTRPPLDNTISRRTLQLSDLGSKREPSAGLKTQHSEEPVVRRKPGINPLPALATTSGLSFLGSGIRISSSPPTSSSHIFFFKLWKKYTQDLPFQ